MPFAATWMDLEMIILIDAEKACDKIQHSVVLKLSEKQE